MQTGQRLDGRDDGRGIPGRTGSRLGRLRLRCALRCRAGLVLRLVLRGDRRLALLRLGGRGAAECVSAPGALQTPVRSNTPKVPNWLKSPTEPYPPPCCCCCTPP